MMALSLVLCLAVTAAIIVQWARSTRGGEMIERNSIRLEPRWMTIINRRAWSTPGTLNLDWSEERHDTSMYASVGSVPSESWVHKRTDGDGGPVERPAGDSPDWLVRLGLNWDIGRSLDAARKVQRRFVWVQVRYWFLLAAAIAMSSVPATAMWRIIRRARRRLVGLCPACGYDMRATPERCPECGAVPAPPHNSPMQRTATASSGAVE